MLAIDQRADAVTPFAVSPVWKSSGYPPAPIAGSSDSIPRSSSEPAPHSRVPVAMNMLLLKDFSSPRRPPW